MKTAGIMIDEWKLPIFERHLNQAGYAFKNAGVMGGSLVLRVDTTNLVALAEVVKAASEEAALTGEPK